MSVAWSGAWGAVTDGALWFFDEVGFLYELIAGMVMFVWWADRRPRWAARLVACVAAMTAVMVAWAAVVPRGVVFQIARLVLCDVMCFGALLAVVAMGVRQAVFYAVGCVALQHCVYGSAQLVAIVASGVTGRPVDAMMDLLYPFLVVPLFAVAYWLFVRPLTGRMPPSIDGRILPLGVGIMLCVNVFSCIFDWSLGERMVGPLSYAMFTLTRLTLCVFLLLMLREIVDRETAERDGEVLRQLLRQQQNQLATDRETVDLINTKTHDLKRQLSLLGGRIPQDEIDDLTSLVGIYDASVHTGNEALDVLLANRSLICERRGVPFDRMIDGSRLGFMKPSDIYALFGNAVDNAMEAVARIDDPARRYIRMTVRMNRGMLVIHVENPFAGELAFHDGLPATTKGDTRYHGFGMRSMRMIVERYHGTMSVKAEDGVFAVNIILPVPAAA